MEIIRLHTEELSWSDLPAASVVDWLNHCVLSYQLHDAHCTRSEAGRKIHLWSEAGLVGPRK